MNKPVSEPVLAEEETPLSEPRWALLERIVASPQLKRATRLREFLLYVGQRSIKDGLDQIHEQEIGAKVFGRAADYDTSLDNIVRVNASELRKRIEDYFASEGASESLIMEIPRGSYKPVFRPRALDPVSEPTSEPVSQSNSPRARAREAQPIESEPAEIRLAPRTSERLLPVLALAAIVVLAAACSVLWFQNRALRRSLNTSPWQNTPALGRFWSGILNTRSNSDIILADTSFALIEDITRKSIPLSDYLSRNYLGRVQSSNMSPDRRLDLTMILQRNNGSLGDFRAAQRILALDPLGKGLRLYSSRDYTPALVKQDNIILIGARKSNPWDDLFAGSMNFTAEYDPDQSVDYIRNKAPSGNEQETYSMASAPPNAGYCVVAYLPNPQQNGKAIIIAGTDSAATEGGGDFLTSEDQLSRLETLLHATTLPYFEVLLQTTNLSGTPINAKIIAYRTYPGAH